MSNFLTENQEEFTNVVDFFKRDISSLRTGRANPIMLDGVQVEAYGVMNPLNGVANITVTDSRSFMITPWDKGVTKAVEKAIVEANLGLGIVNEGDKIRLSIPPLTEENRKELVKKLNERLEKARISLRQVREDIKTSVEGAFEAKEITEDEKFRQEKELDEFVAKRNEELKDLRDKKEKDIMEI
jgi:ribosome recycling factor